MATPTVTEEVGDCFSLDGNIKQSGSAKLLVIQNILASWIVDVCKTILGLPSVNVFIYDLYPREHSKHGGLLLSILTAWSGRG